MMKKNTKQIVSYINANADVNAEEKIKTIRMSSDGFCVAVVSSEKKLDELVQYEFAPNLSMKEKIQAIVEVEKNQKYSCKEKIFRLYTHLNTQIPEEFYTTKDEQSVISLLTDKPEQYLCLAEKIEAWKLYTVSLWEKEFTEEIQKVFPDFQLSSTMASLMNFTAFQQQETALIFVENNNFTVIAAREKGLLGTNTFSFSTEADFLYYCLAFLRKMFVQSNSQSILLCGNIVEGSSLYNAIGKYFSSVKLVSPENTEDFPIENYARYCDLF